MRSNRLSGQDSRRVGFPISAFGPKRRAELARMSASEGSADIAKSVSVLDRRIHALVGPAV